MKILNSISELYLPIIIILCNNYYYYIIIIVTVMIGIYYIFDVILVRLHVCIHFCSHIFLDYRFDYCQSSQVWLLSNLVKNIQFASSVQPYSLGCGTCCKPGSMCTRPGMQHEAHIETWHPGMEVFWTEKSENVLKVIRNCITRSVPTMMSKNVDANGKWMVYTI